MRKKLSVARLSGGIAVFLGLSFGPISLGDQVGSEHPGWLVPLRQSMEIPSVIWDKFKSLIGIKNYYGVTLPADQLEGNAVRTPRPPNCPPSMTCGQCRLLNSAKEWVAKVYKNRPRGHGDCGGAVGDVILNAGFQFIKRPERPKSGNQDKFNRYAIDYLNFLPSLGWSKLDVTDPKEVPPGAIMVFSGPCTTTAHGIGQPEEKSGCKGAPGNRVGHVTIQGDEKVKPNRDTRWTYTDGRTAQPAIPNRYFVAAFVPGPVHNSLCGE